MRGLAIAVLLTVVTLAGCTSKSDSTTTHVATTGATTSAGATSTGTATTSTGPHASSGTTASSTTSSTTTGAAANTPPTATLTASNLTVSIPANVTFHAVGADSDDDALQYDLTFGDGSAAVHGAALPANVTHQYTLVGNFTAMLVVSDGKTTANSTVVVHALAGGAAAKVLTGAVSVNCASACEGCDPSGNACNPVGGPGAGGCASLAASKPGTDCAFWPVTDAAGKAFTATSTGGDPDVEFFDACDAVMGSSLGTSWKVGPEAGTVPDGTGCIIAWEFNAITPPGTSTITFTYS